MSVDYFVESPATRGTIINSWVFLPFWEQNDMANALPFEMDIEALRHTKGRSKAKAILHRCGQMCGFPPTSWPLRIVTSQ